MWKPVALGSESRKFFPAAKELNDFFNFLLINIISSGVLEGSLLTEIFWRDDCVKNLGVFYTLLYEILQIMSFDIGSSSLTSIDSISVFVIFEITSIILTYKNIYILKINFYTKTYLSV